MSLPLARDDDFFGNHRRPVALDPQHLRVINDTALRSRLIMAGIAEGLQSPKGPQRIKSIIRLIPISTPRAPPTNRVRFAVLPPRRTSRSRRARVRAAVGRRAQRVAHAHPPNRTGSQPRTARAVRRQIDRLKKQISTLDGDDFERAFRELETAMRQRRELAGQIREEAFRRIDGDASFEPRRYLRLISRERR